MADYKLQVHGHFAGSIPWTVAVHVTSNQAEAALATTWANAWTAGWTDGAHGLQTLYPVATAIDAVSAATLNGTMHEVSKTTVPLTLPGTSVADTLPFKEATLVSLRSAFIQRGRRGRMYLPAMAEDQVNADILIPAAATRVRDAISAIFTAIRADGSSFFVFNRKAWKDGTLPFQKTIITSQLVSNKPASQRRRVRKVSATYV